MQNTFHTVPIPDGRSGSLLNSPELSMYYSQGNVQQSPAQQLGQRGDTELLGHKEQDNGSVGTHPGPLPSAVPVTPAWCYYTRQGKVRYKPYTARQQEPRTGKCSSHKGQRLQCCEGSKRGKDSGTNPAALPGSMNTGLAGEGTGRMQLLRHHSRNKSISIPPGWQDWLRKALSNAAS